jgi:hypothetical protein
MTCVVASEREAWPVALLAIGFTSIRYPVARAPPYAQRSAAAGVTIYAAAGKQMTSPRDCPHCPQRCRQPPL